VAIFVAWLCISNCNVIEAVKGIGKILTVPDYTTSGIKLLRWLASAVTTPHRILVWNSSWRFAIKMITLN
jgi:hypothetical protein